MEGRGLGLERGVLNGVFEGMVGFLGGGNIL